ncbi:cyclic nucleotide-gated cation channel beta-3-like isoform X2 [Varroa destructor]|uniref:Ion transport domain-containing protein n=1 Tax=Varroa destructor TaxID=109461 RepID=A0A7M7KAA4_VARDE|nr:cyclic nucleotide-gated cation channel beta-3-like isoform X2 [Varroa destructor]
MCARVEPEAGDQDTVRKKECLRHVWMMTPESVQRLLTKTYDPQSQRYVFWQLVVGVVYAYNAWTPLLRVTFWEENTWKLFKTFDIAADIVNIVDVVCCRPREQFYKSGCPVRSFRKTWLNYRTSPNFRNDMLSLLPLEYPFAAHFSLAPLLRLNRLLRIDSYTLIFRKMEMASSMAFLWRLLRIVSYMMMIIHFNACAYFVISRIEGIGSNAFVYPGIGDLPYIRCFYFSFKMAAGIGKNVKPTHELEYIFMAFLWLQGSFIFAFILGQIKDIVSTAAYEETEYQTSMDLVIRHMVQMGIPKELDRKVRRYLVETYATKRTLREDAMLHILPQNLRAEVVSCDIKDIGIRI